MRREVCFWSLLRRGRSALVFRGELQLGLGRHEQPPSLTWPDWTRRVSAASVVSVLSSSRAGDRSVGLDDGRRRRSPACGLPGQVEFFGRAEAPGGAGSCRAAGSVSATGLPPRRTSVARSGNSRSIFVTAARGQVECAGPGCARSTRRHHQVERQLVIARLVDLDDEAFRLVLGVGLLAGGWEARRPPSRLTPVTWQRQPEPEDSSAFSVLERELGGGGRGCLRPCP